VKGIQFLRDISLCISLSEYPFTCGYSDSSFGNADRKEGMVLVFLQNKELFGLQIEP